MHLFVPRYDCVIIPGASRMSDGVKLSVDEFCGGGNTAKKGGIFTGGTIGAGSATQATPSANFRTICSERLRMIITELRHIYTQCHV